MDLVVWKLQPECFAKADFTRWWRRTEWDWTVSFPTPAHSKLRGKTKLKGHKIVSVSLSDHSKKKMTRVESKGSHITRLKAKSWKVSAEKPGAILLANVMNWLDFYFPLCPRAWPGILMWSLPFVADTWTSDTGLWFFLNQNIASNVLTWLISVKFHSSLSLGIELLSVVKTKIKANNLKNKTVQLVIACSTNTTLGLWTYLTVFFSLGAMHTCLLLVRRIQNTQAPVTWLCFTKETECTCCLRSWATEPYNYTAAAEYQAGKDTQHPLDETATVTTWIPQ